MSGADDDLIIDFLARAAADIEHGGLRPLADYVLLFRGKESLIASEYERLAHSITHTCAISITMRPVAVVPATMSLTIVTMSPIAISAPP